MQKRGKIYHLKCNFFAFLLHFLCNAMIIKHQYPTNTPVTVKSGKVGSFKRETLYERPTGQIRDDKLTMS